MAEGMAMFLQFQEQISDMVELGAGPLTAVVATDYFNYLPGAGLLPLASAQAISGQTYAQFFSNRVYRDPVYIEGAKYEPLLFRSWLYPPIDLGLQEMIWLYWVRENVESIVNHTTNSAPYAIFTNGHIPFEGVPQFDLNYWDYANFV